MSSVEHPDSNIVEPRQPDTHQSRPAPEASSAPEVLDANTPAPKPLTLLQELQLERERAQSRGRNRSGLRGRISTVRDKFVKFGFVVLACVVLWIMVASRGFLREHLLLLAAVVIAAYLTKSVAKFRRYAKTGTVTWLEFFDDVVAWPLEVQNKLANRIRSRIGAINDTRKVSDPIDDSRSMEFPTDPQYIGWVVTAVVFAFDFFLAYRLYSISILVVPVIGFVIWATVASVVFWSSGPKQETEGRAASALKWFESLYKPAFQRLQADIKRRNERAKRASRR